ncbi:hypothetical protein [Methylorubrum zatmanii]
MDAPAPRHSCQHEDVDDIQERTALLAQFGLYGAAGFAGIACVVRQAVNSNLKGPLGSGL